MRLLVACSGLCCGAACSISCSMLQPPRKHATVHTTSVEEKKNRLLLKNVAGANSADVQYMYFFNIYTCKQ